MKPCQWCGHAKVDHLTVRGAEECALAFARVRIGEITTAILAEIDAGTFVEGPHRAAAKGAVIALRERLLERGALT